MSRFIMAIDANKCMNCKACVLACQQNNAVPYGYFRNWVKSSPSPASLNGMHYQPGGCMQCDNPLCVQACPTGATTKGADGVVYINPNACIGCSSCIKACPYGARYKDPKRGVADKCDYCLASRQRGEVPACVRICPTKARIFGDMDDPESDVSKAIKGQTLAYVKPTEVDPKPTLVYLGATSPLDWPENTSIPTPLAWMGPVATGVTWLGGISLFGVIACFFRQLIWPSEAEDHAEDNSTAGSTPARSNKDDTKPSI